MEINKIYNENVNETIYSFLSENGLNTFVMPKKGYAKSYAIFATKYGSVDNNFIDPENGENVIVPDGIAHFLEHKLFEEEEGNVFEKYAKTGASANAFTSFNMTAYLFSCTNEFEKNLEILLSFVQKPYFTDENIEKEQGIIGQEIRMYQDDPNWRVFFNMLTALYFEHPVKNDIAGTVSSISKINKEILYKCYNTFYNPSNMVLFVCGDVDYNKVFEIVDKKIIKKSQNNEIKTIYPNEPNKINKKIIMQNLSVSMPLFQIGFKDTDVLYDGEKLLKKEITNNILLEMIAGKSSKLYNYLYSEGLINDTFEADSTLEKDYGFSVIGGESKNPKKVQEILVKEINRLSSEGLLKQDFGRIKKVIFGRYMRQFNNVEKISHSFISLFFKGINLFDYKKAYDSITFDDVLNRFNQHFAIKNMVISIINPHNTKE